jgi:molybdate transport system substrate-binding protein
MSAKVAPAENVRAALALVERGQAPLGVVYATDALASDKVEVVARFPAASHPPIRYPAAVLKASDNADAAPFLAYLQSDEARRIFVRHGFTAPE